MPYSYLDLSSPKKLEKQAKKLVGMTFQDVLDLGIFPEGAQEHTYNNRAYKGGLGVLLEERFFGYKANNDEEADFEEAGVDLKATCYDVKQDGEISVGERLVLTMIPLDREIEDNFYNSHAWEKCQLILLVYYERDKTIDKYEQRIQYVGLFTPSDEDLKIIRDDYKKIADLVQGGRAEELSESLTEYLGACTKGATAEKSITAQFYPPHTPAKKRAFCFKRSYMDYVLHHYLMQEASEEDPIIKDLKDLGNMSLEEYAVMRIEAYIGKTDNELCSVLGLEYTGNKAQWTQIVYALLGVHSAQAEEFVKANISIRTVRVENNGVRESLSLNTFKAKELVKTRWEESDLYEYFETTRFMFVVFEKQGINWVLAGTRFWSMPRSDIDGPLKDCWMRTKKTIEDGVELTKEHTQDGKLRVVNNLPKSADQGAIAHVRPHTSHAAYIFADGERIGDPEKDGDSLPDGRVMTQQSFWLNSSYIYSIVKDILVPSTPF